MRMMVSGIPKCSATQVHTARRRPWRSCSSPAAGRPAGRPRSAVAAPGTRRSSPSSSRRSPWPPGSGTGGHPRRWALVWTQRRQSPSPGVDRGMEDVGEVLGQRREDRRATTSRGRRSYARRGSSRSRCAGPQQPGDAPDLVVLGQSARAIGNAIFPVAPVTRIFSPSSTAASDGRVSRAVRGGACRLRRLAAQGIRPPAARQESAARHGAPSRDPSLRSCPCQVSSGPPPMHDLTCSPRGARMSRRSTCPSPSVTPKVEMPTT